MKKIFPAMKTRNRACSAGASGRAVCPASIIRKAFNTNPAHNLICRLTGNMPVVLNQAKVALAVLAGIVLPLVALFSSIAIFSEERYK